MKTNLFLAVGMALMLSACGNGNGTYDASGIFEATEIMVSAKGTGEIMQFNIQEGQNLEANKQVGYIDTTQLYLKKVQLMANMKAVESRHYNVSKQIASIQQQIVTKKPNKNATKIW